MLGKNLRAGLAALVRGTACTAVLAWHGCASVAAQTAPAATTTSAAPVVSGAAADSSATATAGVLGQPVELKIANRPILTLRAHSFGLSPAERARLISDALPVLVERGGGLEVRTSPVDGGIAILVDGAPLFRVLDGDVNSSAGETPTAVAADAVRNLQLALGELREARDSRALLPALLHAALATLVAALLLWLTWRVHQAVKARLRAFVVKHRDSLVPGWGRHFFGASTIERLMLRPPGIVAGLLGLFIAYDWLGYVLKQFPYTRPWGEALFDNLLEVLGTIGSGIAGALPGLVFAAFIFYIARILTRTVRGFFAGVQGGRVRVGWVDEVTAQPTARLINAVIWLFALVAAYPYIPGTSSEAFKGIGVFVGLMLSIGSSGIVNQAVSGLMLMYTRALRPGEFVQIGETEGTVRSVGFVNTRIETLRHEEVSIPNAVIAASVTRNMSRLAGDGGVFLPTKVTIGYDAPWRQVHAMLILAASRTRSIAATPPPRVLQTALQDFYVEYTLLVTIADPKHRLVVLDELHANIQDVFNENGVQIMSPHYERDPEIAKIVPPADWHRAPAEK